MRITPVLLIITAMAVLSGCQEKYQNIGEFEATVNREKIVFPSYRNTEKNRGGITFRYSGDNKKMSFEGLAGDFQNGMPDLPMLLVTFKSDLKGGNVEIESIKLHKKTSIRTVQHVFYRANETLGEQWASELQLDDQGNVSFNFRGVLMRIDANTNKPVEDENGIHVEGRFKGMVPADELER